MNRRLASLCPTAAIVPAVVCADPAERIEYPKTRCVNHVDSYFGVKVTRPVSLAGGRRAARQRGCRLGGGPNKLTDPISGIDRRARGDSPVG